MDIDGTHGRPAAPPPGGTGPGTPPVPGARPVPGVPPVPAGPPPVPGARPGPGDPGGRTPATDGTEPTRKGRTGPPPAAAPGARPVSGTWPAPPDATPPAGPDGAGFVAWLRAPRPDAEPGVWRYAYRARPQSARGADGDRSPYVGALVTLLACLLAWSLFRNGYIPYWRVPLELVTPHSWWVSRQDDQLPMSAVIALDVYDVIFLTAVVVWFARLGDWRGAFERGVAGRGALARVGAASLCMGVVALLIHGGFLPVYDLAFHLTYANLDPGLDHVAKRDITDFVYVLIYVLLFLAFAPLGGWFRLFRAHQAREEDPAASTRPADPRQDPAEFPALREGGAADAADRLAEDARAGRMNDVDFARLARAWQSVRSEPGRLPAFTDTVLRYGPAACAHPSGARDLPVRAARHDLFAGQVRIGTASEDERNPRTHRGSGFALDTSVLGTSLLAVGPPGSGKTVRIVRPVLEFMCLQALAGRAAVVAVGTDGARLAPDESFDVVVKIGRPDSAYDLDLYGGAGDPDEAAGFLAEALVGDLAAALPGGDSRRAATALAQLLGPFHAAHGRFPSVPELRELLDGTPAALAALRAALQDRGPIAQAQLRELDARERQSARPGDAGPLLADRIALLDRPAFAGFFDTTGGSHPFSLRGLEHPLRVRIDLPERGHAEVSRILARLVLAQFAECAVARQDRSLFACLVLDDASHTVTAESVRGLQRMRSANAGAVLTLRTLDDVPEPLRAALLGAVGCRAALSGVTAWDGARFAEVWGKEWVDVQDVTNRQIIADEPLTRVLHTVRRLVTGKAVTAESITVRKVERERWSASDLAHVVPAGHAVLSLTAVDGEHASPVLVDLRSG
ncbi:ATP-binding protein [Streptomyces sp. NPDC058691]|uniref:ATP-binding protein n=1 Tax=Streptomyces sp. NPDC058691 TaxID=3346601 RepID=UPI00364EE2E1